MIKKRRAPRLSKSDIHRYARRLEKNLMELLPGSSWSLAQDNPPAPQDSQCLLLPLIHRGRALGFIEAFNESGWDSQISALLPGILNLVLEKMWLKKACFTDLETGLHNRDYFNGALLNAIKKGIKKTSALSMNRDDSGMSNGRLSLALVEMRHSDNNKLVLPQEIKKLADALKKHIPLRRLARISPKRLAFLWTGQQQDLENKIYEALAICQSEVPGVRLSAALSVWPKDLKSDSSLCGITQQAEALMDKASTALFHARQSNKSPSVVCFENLIKHHGQVVQLLPLDRVVINLGLDTGAASGQVFMVQAPKIKGQNAPAYKGEITIFESTESYSIGYISSTRHSGHIVAGDRLHFSRLQWEHSAGAPAASPLSGVFLNSLADADEFCSELEKIDGPGAMALIRLDAYEKTVSLLGREEFEKKLNFVFEKSLAAFPEACLKGLWQKDTLALAWVEQDASQIKPAALKLVADMKESGPLSIGLAFCQGDCVNLADDAKKALNEATFSGPGEVAVFGPLSLNISGDHLFEGGDYNGAVKEYERGLELAPDHLNILNSLGVCHGRLGHFDEALASFDKILQRDPNYMMAHYNRGYTYILSGRMEEAEEALSKAAELAPDNFETLFHLGKTALELGHLDKALAALKKAAEQKDSRPAVFRLLGEAQLLVHDTQGALGTFKKAVKAAPNDAYVLSALGALFVEQAKDFEVARSLFQRSVEIDPTNSLYRQRLGRLLFSQGEFDEAQHHLKMAVEYGSRSPEVHYQLGCLAEEMGRIEEAPKHFQAALQQDPAFAPALAKISDKKKIFRELNGKTQQEKKTR